MTSSYLARALMAAGAFAFATGGSTSANAASDPGKKACVKEAKQLCPAEMKSLSRKKVEACMIVKIEQTSPVCHAAMLKIKNERETAIKR
jgi:hypothetical protein